MPLSGIRSYSRHDISELAWSIVTIRHRVRIQFSKQGDLRLIGHRDLARVFERMFRRTGLELKMSEGFHPKAKMSFPSALAVGVEGTNEVMEVELSHPVESNTVRELLGRHAPPGLVINSVMTLGEKTPKARVQRLVYEVQVPASRRDATQLKLQQLTSQECCMIERPGRKDKIDLLAGLETLELIGGVLRIVQLFSSSAMAKPREIMSYLELDDLESEGIVLQRTAVELI